MEDKITLPFLETKQQALIGHMFGSESFFKAVCTKIKPEWFLSEKNSILYKYMLNYYKKYSHSPTITELKNFSEITALEPKKMLMIQAHADVCRAATGLIRLSSITPELTEWLHSVILVKSLKEAERLFNNKNIKECHTKLMESVREISNTSFDKGQIVDFKDYKHFLQVVQEERKMALSTGLTLLDQAILKNAVGGGLQKGDTTIVMAPVNQGKSSFLITVICHNIRSGKDVLYMTHEGSPSDLRLKIMANMLDCEIDQVFKMGNTQEGLRKLETVSKLLDAHLRYIPYNKAGMTIEDVVPIIRLNQEEWMAAHEGKGFDLLVSDYPAILSTEQARKGNLNRRDKDQIVYNYYIQLALEYGFHSLLAIQTNRDGSRINRGQGDHRLLTLEDVSESWDPIKEATNIITLNRPPEAHDKGYVIYYVCKSRGNQTGLAIAAQSKFGHCVTHSNMLKSIQFVGSRSDDERINDLILQINNSRIN